MLLARRPTLLGSTSAEHPAGPSKGFLNFLARLDGTGPGSTGRELFCRYHRTHVLVGPDLNLNAFARWKRGQAEFYAALYGSDERKDPRHFSIKNQFDVGRIAQLLDLNLVIYCGPDPLSRYDRLNVYHQYADFAEPGRRTVNFFFTYGGGLYHISPLPAFVATLLDSVTAEIADVGAAVASLEGGMGAALSRALARDAAEGSEVLDREVRSLRDLIFLKEGAEAVLSRAARPMVVAVYTRRGSLTARYKGSQLFAATVIEIVYRSPRLNYNASGRTSSFTLPQAEGIDFLLSVGGTDCIFVPAPNWRRRIYSLLSLAPAEDKFDSAYVFSGLAPGKDFDQRVRERRKKAEERRKERYGGTKRPRRACRKNEDCRCEVCRASLADYEFNMDEAGPERLLTVDFGCRELLALLGLDSPAHLAAVERMVELSVSAFDIESKNVALDSSQPDETLFASVDPQMSADGHLKKVQRPIMVAHLDSLDEGREPQCWTVKDDEETSCFEMMQAYFAAVQCRKARAEAVKTRLCSPLLAKLRTAQERLADYLRAEATPPTREDESAEKRIRSACAVSLYGKLERRLLDLCGLYVVFSFYGSGYDHVLLKGYLAPLWYEKKLRPRIEMRGNKVTAITLRGNLTFRDITKMLAPGTNLRNFGRLFGLEQKKAHFPFSILTSVRALELPSLPEEESAWQSDLGGAPVTRGEIDEARALFEEAGCNNVGDYLRTYLRLDVVVLFRAVQLWRRSLLETVGVDFVEARKFTISSMSNYAGSLCQAQRMRVGCFFPNNRRHYGLLKRGMRG